MKKLANVGRRRLIPTPKARVQERGTPQQLARCRRVNTPYETRLMTEYRPRATPQLCWAVTISMDHDIIVRICNDTCTCECHYWSREYPS